MSFLTKSYTSFGDTTRSTATRREMRVINPSILTKQIATIRDQRLDQTVPAVVGITSRVHKTTEINGIHITQWQSYGFPVHDRIDDRMTRVDMRTAITKLNETITQRLPPIPSGAYYALFFSIPCVSESADSEENLLEALFLTEMAHSVKESHRINKTSMWNKFLYRIGVRQILPFLDVSKTDEIQELIKKTLEPHMYVLWNSWTADPIVSKSLLKQGVPLSADHRTMFIPDRKHGRIIERLGEQAKTQISSSNFSDNLPLEEIFLLNRFGKR